jgi:hypothetical protein
MQILLEDTGEESFALIFNVGMGQYYKLYDGVTNHCFYAKYYNHKTFHGWRWRLF